MKTCGLRYTLLNRALVVLLLSVMAGVQFIAAFHHHVVNRSAIQTQTKIKHPVISSLSESCKICDLLKHNTSHNYHLPTIAIFFIIDFVERIFVPAFPFKLDAEILGFSNKGPPLI